MTQVELTPDYWQQAQDELSAADPVMAKLITTYAGEFLQSRGDAFYTLARSIAGQQISVKAADAVWGRLEARAERIEAREILKLSEDELRACGLSRQKIAYMKNIAEFFLSENVSPQWFAARDDEQVIKGLTQIKGVGVWTAEMFLMFHLLRPDVWPVDDIGLQKGVQLHYDAPLSDNKREMKQHYSEQGERFKPWRSVATWYLWRALDPVPVAY